MAVKKGEIRDWVIYKITSPSGRVYIGKTCNYKSRLRSYKCVSSCSKQPVIYRSICKYGINNHDFSIIENFTSDLEYACGKEIFWIRSFMSNINKYPELNGLNMTDGGDGTLGYKKSEEERKRMTIRYTGRKTSDYQKLVASFISLGNKYNLGRKKTQEQKNYISKILKGRKMSESQREANRLSNIRVRGISICVENKLTGEIFITETIKKAAKIVGVTRDTLSRIIKSGNELYTNKNNTTFIIKRQ